MTGSRKGSSLIFEEKPKTLLFHCCGDALYLAVSETVKGCQVIKYAFDTTFEGYKLIG